MYETLPDPYCYPNSVILRNLADLQAADALKSFEEDSVALRMDEPFPAGRLSVTHYCAIHRHLFQDVYAWAGRFRKVRIAKGGNMFCYPEYIKPQMVELFAQLRTDGFLRQLGNSVFAQRLTDFMATLNAIHPFREGNGRTQLVFASILAAQAGYALRLEALDPDQFLDAMIASFGDDTAPLRSQIEQMLS